MNEYVPHNWVVLRYGNVYKVLAAWSGGYLDDDTWRMNSGITSAKQDGNFFLFYGASGSCYRCHRDRYRLIAASAPIYNAIKYELKEEVELMPENTNWMEIEYVR